MYSDGDIIGTIGNTCLSSGDSSNGTYTGEQSECVNGTVVVDDYLGHCAVEDGYVCCQTANAGTRGGAVCARRCIESNGHRSVSQASFMMIILIFH